MRTFAIDFRRQLDRSLERPVINLKRQQLDRPRFAVRRLWYFAHSPQYETLRLDRKIDRRFIDAGEVDTDPDRAFASEGVDGRLPFVRRRAPQLHPRHLIRQVTEGAVQPTQFDVSQWIHSF